MSWDTYVTNLESTGHVAQAAILGHNGSVWAKSKSLELNQPELAAILSGFAKPSDLLANGVKVAGVKYLTITANEEEIYGKKGQCGLALYKTKQAIVLGLHADNVQPGQCKTAVGRVADHLKEANY